MYSEIHHYIAHKNMGLGEFDPVTDLIPYFSRFAGTSLITPKHNKRMPSSARPPKMSGSNSLALFTRHITSQAFFIGIAPPAFRDIMQSQPPWDHGADFSALLRAIFRAFANLLYNRPRVGRHGFLSKVVRLKHTCWQSGVLIYSDLQNFRATWFFLHGIIICRSNDLDPARIVP